MINRRHICWGAIGALLAASLAQADTTPGAVLLLATIGACFALWGSMGGREVWVAMVVTGVAMAGVLGWATATSAGCPKGDDLLVLRADKPPVSCAEIRASYASMATFFGIVALIGLAVPFIARRRDEWPDDADAAGDPESAHDSDPATT